MRSWKIGSVSGPGTAGMLAAWWLTPSSKMWKDADSAKMVLPCWIATTRRVVNDRPSRTRSTL